MKQHMTILAIIILLFSSPVLGQIVGKEKLAIGDQQISSEIGMNISNISNATEMMKFIKNIREKQGIQGLGFIHSEGNTFGEFVTFSVDNKTGNILDYSVKGTKLFDIVIDNFGFKSTENIGTMTIVTGSDARIIITDSPAAILTIMTMKPQTVTFNLAKDVTAEKIGMKDTGNLVKITSGNIVGELISNNITISSENKLAIKTSPSGIIVFRVSPVNMPMFGDLQERIAREIANNRMGTEVSISSNTVSTANFTDVETTVQAMGNASISMKVSSSTTAGRTISINLDNSSLVVGNNQKLVIRYDGKDLQCVSDPNMVFNGTDQPACWISPIQNGVKTQILIFVPHFSEHNIEIAVEPVGGETPETIATNATVTKTEVTATTTTTKSPGFEILGTIITLLGSAFLILRKHR